MDKENFNNSRESSNDGRAEWQSLGHKVAEQIASHTTMDSNGDATYLGQELPKEIQVKVEESGFEKPGEEPRGTSRDGAISTDAYPKQPNELDWQFRNRINSMQDKTDSATVQQIRNKAQQILNNNAISNVYNHLLEQGTIHNSNLSGKQKNTIIDEARELSLKTINHYYRKMLPNNNKHKLYVGEAYEKVYTDKIINDDSTPQVTKKELEDASIDQAMLDARQDDFNERWFYEEKKPSWKYQKDSTRVANGVLQKYTHDIFSGLFDDDLELSKDETKKRQRAVIKTTIRSGLFMPNTTVENPERADAILAENGIDKNSAQITAYAVDGVNEVDGHRKKEIANYFDLNNKISSMIDDSNFTFTYKNTGGQDELRVEYDAPYYERDYSLNDWLTERVLDPETTHNALDRLKDASNQIKDSINENPEYIERVKKQTRNFSEYNMINRVSTTQNAFVFRNILNQLDVKKIDCGNEIINHFIAERNDSESFSRLLADYMDANRLDNPNLEVDVDYRKAIQDGLIMRLAQGVTKNGNRDKFLTHIFETQEYEDNEKKIGLDFADKTIIPPAFNGFINVIKTTNGEYSAEANWYYDNIFSKNPEIFYSTIEAFRKTSKDIGAKRKLTNFGSKDGNEAFYTYLNTLDENPELENQRVIKKSRLINTNKQGLLHAVEVYKRRMYNKFLQTNPSLLNNQNTKNGTNVNLPGKRFPNLGITQKDNPPFDYGLQKAATFFKYLDFVDENIPNSNVKTFELIFGDKAVGVGDSNHYMGFSFNYEGKRCAIAESLHPTASTYLINSDIEEYEVSPDTEIEPFLRELSGKTKTEVSQDSNVASVIHFGKKRFDESLDADYQKGFMFFRTGDKNSVKYGWAGNRESWEQLHNQQFPAWPMLFDNGAQMDDLAGYQAWQEEKMNKKDELINEKLQMWNRE